MVKTLVHNINCIKTMLRMNKSRKSRKYERYDERINHGSRDPPSVHVTIVITLAGPDPSLAFSIVNNKS